LVVAKQIYFGVKFWVHDTLFKLLKEHCSYHWEGTLANKYECGAYNEWKHTLFLSLHDML